IAQPPCPRTLRLASISAQKLSIPGELLFGDRRPLLAIGQRPDMQRPVPGTVPADDLARIRLQQELQGVRREPPVVLGKVVHAKEEGARDDERAVGPQNALDLLEASPEVADMLEGVASQDRAGRLVRLRKLFHVGYTIDARARPHV